MDIPNAFIGRTGRPSEAELATALGPAAPLWAELIREVEADTGELTEEWKGVYANKFGWTLRLMKKNRKIAYLSPCQGCFRVAFLLNDKALNAAREAHLPKPVTEALAAAPHYPEGTGLRLMVNRTGDLAPIRKLAKIKLES